MSKKKNKTSKNDNNLAIAYYRYSSHSQNELSIDQQRAQAQKYAETHGLQIVREYEDKAMTGTNDDRPGFQQMLSEVGKIKPAALILWKTDRLGRDRYDLAISKKKIRDAGCEILYIAEALPTSTPEASLMEGLLESMAEFYSKPLFLFRRTQKSCADPGIDKIGDKGAEAHIREEMIGHVDAVIAVEQHENTGAKLIQCLFPLLPLNTSTSIGRANIMLAIVMLPLGQLLKLSSLPARLGTICHHCRNSLFGSSSVIRYL